MKIFARVNKTQRPWVSLKDTVDMGDHHADVPWGINVSPDGARRIARRLLDAAAAADRLEANPDAGVMHFVEQEF